MENTRRQFIKKIGSVSIAFAIAEPVYVIGQYFSVEAPENKLNKEEINSWLEVLENGRVRIFTGKLELGQGIRTAIMQMAAEELDTSLDLIEVHMAETGVTPDEGFTAASRSIETSAMSVRQAAASAREIILKIAAKKWELPASELNLKDGRVTGQNKEAYLHEILEGKQIDGAVDSSVAVKGKTVRKYVGQPIPRKDIETMVRGDQIFVQDLRFPGMLHARVVHPPSYTSKIVSVNAAEIEELPSLVKMVRKDSFIGVLAEKEYEAISLAQQVKSLVSWDAPSALPDQNELKSYLKSLPVEEKVQENRGNAESVLATSEHKLEASFFKPYLMHAANGPSCAVAFFENDMLQIWSHCQGAYPLRRTIAKLMEMPEDSVNVKAVPGSGCFGHNGANDVATEAALLAREYPGRHIRLQWSRDDENRWEPFGTAMIADLQASLNADGKIAAWKCDVWSDGHSNRPNENPNTLLPSFFLEKDYGHPGIGYRGGAWRNAAPYYTIPNLKVDSHMFQGPLRISSLRSLGTYTNIFAIESFMDELAEKAGKDPFQFRLEHSEDPRAIECIMKLQPKVEGLKLKNNEGLGIAFSRYKNATSYCAMAAKVHVNRANGKVRVEKLWAVVEAGETINPDGLKNQVEGGMIQSASWALLEEVKFGSTHITSLDWATYPILRFPDTPEVEVEIIDRVEEPAVGAGEASMAPTTAAIANAVYKACGVRIRSLPITKELLKS
ncbi:molybdopterin cofactor-binding domain-containing protein [Pseudozobellia sp. WGM2]|uniref:xanthine dehydrogenase family protein molybdopterin-binding subunit n=1 Tax=Pseudozobellia sp. WGM2 TaxID=2787625 RepID=UPI001ADF50CB|nr:molybdopterin cofactor-binding domain-containing protein [Pseudozobellia sp. WGM2]